MRGRRAASKTQSVVSLSFGGDGAVETAPTNTYDVGAMGADRQMRRSQGGWTLRDLRAGFIALPTKRKFKGSTTAGEAFDELWGALNAWLLELLEAGKGGHIHNFAKFTWATSKPFIKGATGKKGRYVTQKRPVFELAAAFVRQNNILLKSQKAPRSLDDIAVEDINFTKLAIRYTESLSKDAMFTGMRDVLRMLGRAIGTTQTSRKVAVDFSFGTLYAKQRKVWFVFDRDVEMLFAPKGATPLTPRMGLSSRDYYAAADAAADAAAADAAADAAAMDAAASKVAEPASDAFASDAAASKEEPAVAAVFVKSAEQIRLEALRALGLGKAPLDLDGETGVLVYRESPVIEAAHERHVGRLRIGIVAAEEEKEEFKAMIIRKRRAAEAKAEAKHQEELAHQDFLLGQINDTTTVRAAAPSWVKTAPCVFPAMEAITKEHVQMSARTRSINVQNKLDLERIMTERERAALNSRDNLMSADMKYLERCRQE